jgi:GYF domain 2/Family of unknown function (DUF6232)
MSTVFVLKEGQKWGPYTTEELEEYVETGSFIGTDLVWSEGMEDWIPLESVVVRINKDWKTYYHGDGIQVTDHWVKLNDKSIPLEMIAKASLQTETIKRTRSLIGTILLGVALLCLPAVLMEIPHSSTAVPLIGGIIFLVLFFGWLGLLYAAIRPARSMVVLDLKDGDERILQIQPSVGSLIEQALRRALADFHAA